MSLPCAIEKELDEGDAKKLGDNGCKVVCEGANMPPVPGGIDVVNKSQRQSRVPYRPKLPIRGRAFRSAELSDSRKELLIFVSPQVVHAPLEAS